MDAAERRSQCRLTTKTCAVHSWKSSLVVAATSFSSERTDDWGVGVLLAVAVVLLPRPSSYIMTRYFETLYVGRERKDICGENLRIKRARSMIMPTADPTPKLAKSTTITNLSHIFPLRLEILAIWIVTRYWNTRNQHLWSSSGGIFESASKSA